MAILEGDDSRMMCRLIRRKEKLPTSPKKLKRRENCVAMEIGRREKLREAYLLIRSEGKKQTWRCSS